MRTSLRWCEACHHLQHNKHALEMFDQHQVENSAESVDLDLV